MNTFRLQSFRLQHKDLANFAFSDIHNPDFNPHWNQPFHHEVKDFPIKPRSSSRRRIERISSSTESTSYNNKPSYVPKYLPNFPPHHTYSNTTYTLKKSKTAEQQDLKDKTLTKNAVKSIQSTLSKIA